MRITIITLALLAGLALGEDKQISQPLITIVTENFAPYNYEQNGELKGSCTQVIQALIEELKLENYEIKVYPWFRAFHEATTKENVLIYSMVRTPEREKQFKWVGVLDSTDIGILTLAENDYQMEKISDINKYETVVFDKGPLAEYFNSQGISLRVIKEWKAAIRLLMSKRIDVYPTSIEAFILTANEMGYSENSFKKIFDLPELEDYLWAAFSIETPDSTVEKFRKALKRVQAKRK